MYIHESIYQFRACVCCHPIGRETISLQMLLYNVKLINMILAKMLKHLYCACNSMDHSTMYFPPDLHSLCSSTCQELGRGIQLTDASTLSWIIRHQHDKWPLQFKETLKIQVKKFCESRKGAFIHTHTLTQTQTAFSWYLLVDLMFKQMLSKTHQKDWLGWLVVRRPWTKQAINQFRLSNIETKCHYHQ